MTGWESRSLGAVEFRRHLLAAQVTVGSEYKDEGQKHYIDATKGTGRD